MVNKQTGKCTVGTTLEVAGSLADKLVSKGPARLGVLSTGRTIGG